MRWEYLELRVHALHDFWADSLGRGGKLSSGTGGQHGAAGVWNALGDEGWELVGIASGDPPNQSYLAIFKRPRQTDRYEERENGLVHAPHLVRRAGT